MASPTEKIHNAFAFMMIVLLNEFCFLGGIS
jgi:hypothetical protein